MIVMRGVGQDTDYRGAIVGYGLTRDAVGGGGGPTTPTPYGADRTERVYRDDQLTEARYRERVGR